MQCPLCKHPEHRVVDSRTSRGGRAIRRRRECLECGGRFTTYEQAEEEPLIVIKRDGRSEAYDRSKLLGSIRLACAKRPVSSAEVDSLVNEVEAELATGDHRDVASGRLGELVMERLRTRDQVAYVRFASVYRNFQDTTEFMEEVRELLRRAGTTAPGQVDLFPAVEAAAHGTEDDEAAAGEVTAEAAAANGAAVDEVEGEVVAGAAAAHGMEDGEVAAGEATAEAAAANGAAVGNMVAGEVEGGEIAAVEAAVHGMEDGEVAGGEATAEAAAANGAAVGEVAAGEAAVNGAATDGAELAVDSDET